jgi:hypothetical protein
LAAAPTCAESSRSTAAMMPSGVNEVAAFDDAPLAGEILPTKWRCRE